MSDIGSAFSDLGGAVGDLFASEGSAKAAGAYGTAATIAQQNEALTLRSGQIQEQQEQIAITKAIGGEEATTSGAGLNNSGGTATDLLRASVSQGALAKQLIGNQTEITAQGYAQQSAAYIGQQQAAQMQAKGQAGGGIMSALGAVASVAMMFL